MLNTVLVLLWIASLISIYYFWKKRPNKKYKRISIAVCIMLFFAIGLLPENHNQTQPEQTTKTSRTYDSPKETSKSSSNQNKNQSHDKNKAQRWLLKRKAEKLELGTSMNEVEKKLGNPVRKDGQMLTYDDFRLYFEKGKLVGSDLPAIQKKVTKKIEKTKEDKQRYNDKLQSFAQSFGNKPVSEIQRMPSTYVTERVGNKTIYGWHPEGVPELVRVDDPETNNTDVYVFDKNGQDNMLGKHLYTGRTIFQKQPKYVPQY